LCAFAANSLLCRLALGSGAIDAATYASVRLLSGAAVLVPLAFRRAGRPAGSWPSAAMLFAYAVPFSFAYRTLSAGTGALILFAAVQTTMISAGLRSGERPGAVQWLGLLLAFFGLGYLVRPGLAAPSPVGAGLMAVAGIAWGAYSLRGRRAGQPIAETAGNFACVAPGGGRQRYRSLRCTRRRGECSWPRSRGRLPPGRLRDLVCRAPARPRRGPLRCSSRFRFSPPQGRGVARRTRDGPAGARLDRDSGRRRLALAGRGARRSTRLPRAAPE
jgi:hypothetical protein